MAIHAFPLGVRMDWHRRRKRRQEHGCCRCWPRIVVSCEAELTHGCGIHHLAVASNTVFLHHLRTCGMDTDDLGLGVKSEDGGMAQAVAGFKEVFPYHVVVRYVTVIAGCNGMMATGSPGGELRTHDVTVHANF